MREWQAYDALGYATVPLTPRSKRPAPAARRWQDRRPADLWAHAPPDANVGLRCGDAELAVLDCDDFETSEYALRLWDGLGLTPVGSLTRRGTHLYIRTRPPDGFAVAGFAAPDWTGELRARRAYVVAPPSTVAGWDYSPVGDVRAVPAVEWRDLAHLIRPTDKPTYCEGYGTTYRKAHLRACVLPSGVLELVEAIRLAPDGAPVEAYGKVRRSRSEALAVLWRRCLEAGLDPTEAAALVGPIAGRSIKDLTDDARRVYGKVLASRSAYAEIARDASRFALLGRADAVRNQAKVLRAAARLAEQKGGGYLLHIAEVSGAAGLTERTAKRCLARLVDAGYMRRGRRGKWVGFYVEVRRA